MSNHSGTYDYTSREMYRKLLSVIVSHEGETKQGAEEEIQKLQSKEGFGINLTELVLDPNCSLPVRGLASITLKKYVETHWCSTTENFLSPEINLNNKTKIKELLLTGLLESNSEMRDAVADIISVIIPWDWADNWPGLFETLVNCLNGKCEFAIHGGMRVLRNFTNQVTDIYMPNVGSVILQEMNRIFKADHQYSVDIRSQAIKIFLDIVSNISSYQKRDLIQCYLQPEISVFCETAILSWRSQNDLKTDIIAAIQILMERLPKCTADFLPNMLPLIWQTLIDIAKDYRANTVNRGRGDNNGNRSDVEKDNNTGSLVTVIFDYIEHLLSGAIRYELNIPDYKLVEHHWFYLQDCFIPPQALRHLIMLMEITEERIELWENNVSHFVEQEDLKSHTRDGIRREAEELFEEIVDYPERAIVSGLIIEIMKHVETENAMRVNGKIRVNQNWWKSHEAFLLAFSLMKEIIVQRKKSGSLGFDVAAFLKNVVLADLKNPESHPLLVGRCLCVGGLYADQMRPELSSHFLKATVNALQENQPACIKICAAKAAYFWYCRDDSGEGNNHYEKILRFHVPGFFQGLSNLATDYLSREVLTLVLKGFASLVPYDAAFTASVSNEILSLTMMAFLSLRVKDSYCSPWLNVFKELTLNPKCIQELQRRLRLPLVRMMTTNPPEQRGDERIAFDVVQTLVQHSPQPLSTVLIKTVFPACCHCIVSTEDHYIRECGIEVIQTYHAVAPQQMIDYRDNSGKTGPQYILQAVVPVLHAQCDIFRNKKAWKMVTFLIKETGDTLGENIDQLLKVVLSKMQSKPISPCFRQELLMVYAHLFNVQLNIVINFLSNAPAVAEPNALTLIISEGLCREYNSFNVEDRKIVKLALSKILEHSVTNPFSRLHQITFKEDGTKTIPLLVKICKLTINEQSNIK